MLQQILKELPTNGLLRHVFLSLVCLLQLGATWDKEAASGVRPTYLSLPTLRNYSSVVPGKQVIRLGYLTGSDGDGDMFYRKPGQAISGALTWAVDQINSDPEVLPDHNLEFLIAETYGEEEESIRMTALLPNYNISTYIGPQETCVHEGRIAAAFNMPMISYFCAMYEVSDKKLYPTFARTKPHDSRISMSLVSLLREYQWHKVVFVHSDQMGSVADTIHAVLGQHGINVTARCEYDGPYFHEQTSTPFAKIVADTYQRTRIYVMLGEYYEFVGLMVSLLLRGLLDTGEYFVVGVDTGQYDPNDPQKYLEGLFQGTPTPDSIKAFQSFVGISPAPAVYPWYQNFSEVVNAYLEKPPFNFHNPYRKHGHLKIIRPEAAYLYDAVWIYARAAHKAILNGSSPSDGRAIFNFIKETTYQSAMGYINRIDANGDAEGNFTLLARKKGDKGWGIYPVGTFGLNENTAGLPVLSLLEGEEIQWVGDRSPIDEPKCGFYGERCIPGPNYTPQIVGGVIGAVLFITIIVAVLVYRNWRYEQELASLLWKIDYKEIVMRDHMSQYTGTHHGYSSINRMGAGLRSSMVSLTSQVDLDLRQVFTQVGTYKKSIVAIKRVNKRYVDLTRNVRKELKMIRDIRHDNLNTFIGACVDPGNICIVTEYCSKGSLQDILANDDVKLDNMFFASLIFDIIKGMSYLHDSPIRSHGRLKSSNCVVDSRWVLKLTDYALWEFKEGAEADPDVSEHTHYQSLLWTAPELLRQHNAPPSGTQKGDVFSFAIILYEMYGRAGPYGDIDLAPKDIIQQLTKLDEEVPFRPKLGGLGPVPKFVTDCIKDCWAEEPLVRPDFKTIRHKLKPMQKGMKPNIFDNMMAIMEKYATNLEGIVEERTDQLREEKKRTEELLHQMLPKVVAEQLKMGKQVEAEAFDSVTIYFSDICGFTSMSSESTPLQVVDLLNDLYTTCDFILGNYDVYKVETIGDAYMVVSGLPKRNGIHHAGEIASMSLHLLTAIKRFKIRHRPTDTLKLRIGLHSGSCVAGVVGLKMPRYCLFGDTVNTASRMESNGEALKIHCSPQTKELLDRLGGYYTEERGLVTMKGKGEVRTYWVTGEDKQRRMSRLAPPKPASPTRTADDGTPCRLARSPNLHRGGSVPTLGYNRSKNSLSLDHSGSRMSDKHSGHLPNGLIARRNSDQDPDDSHPPFQRMRYNSDDMTIREAHALDHVTSKRGFKMSDVRIKVPEESNGLDFRINDLQGIPCLGPGDDPDLEDSDWRSSTVSRDMTCYQEEASPLLCHVVKGDTSKVMNGKIRRSLSGETSV